MDKTHATAGPSLNAILAHCQLDGECLIWHSNRDAKGYGRVYIDGKYRGLHRLVWEVVNGAEIPQGYCVCHTCDNPPCIWPEHLWIGTKAQNTLDRDLKRRNWFGPRNRGETNARAKLTDAQVRAIRADPRLQRMIAVEYGITTSSVSEIKAGKRWKHLA